MLDAIAGSAARWFSVPRALILLDANRLDGLRCSYGVLDGWTEREAAICYHSFAPPETCVVENLAQDARFSGHPLVTSPSGIRFYAGSPIVGPEGERWGIICLLDRRPRRLDPRQIRMLQDLAELTASYLAGWISSCRPLEDPLAFDAGERRYRELFENTTDIVFTHDLVGQLTAVNRAAEKLTGFSREELLEMKLTDLVSPAYTETARQMILQQFGAGASQTCRLAFRTKDGRLVDVEVSAHLLFERGRPVGLMGFAREITASAERPSPAGGPDQKLRESAGELMHLAAQWKQLHRLATTHYERTEDLFRDFVKTGCDILQLPAGVIAEVNGNRCKIRTAYPNEDFVGWKSEIALPETRFTRTVSWGRTCEYHVRRPRLRRPIFAPRAAASVICTPIYVGGRVYGVLGFASRRAGGPSPPWRKEIVEFLASSLGGRLLAEEWRAASRDSLTGLPNAGAVETSLNEALRTARSEAAPVAIVLMDVDLFQGVNARFGHAVGDTVLRGIARRLNGCLRDGDVLGRLGADRFLAVLNNLSGAEEAERIALTMVEVVRKPFVVQGKRVAVSLSAGVSLFPRDGRSVRTLLGNADVALRIAKQRGRNGLEIFTPGARPEQLGRIQIVKELHEALENGQFRLRFQPEFRLDGTLDGLEVLLAWRHPQLGLIPAGRFIPLAEDSGIIVPLGAWVLSEACRQCASWRAAGHAPVRIAVNISTLQIARPDFLELVSQLLSDYDLPAETLELEITESAVMRDVTESIRAMNRLRELGVSLAIDDFGTGYSSLSYLSRLPVNAVKIDQSFLQQAHPPESALPIIEAIVALAHNLGLAVVGEGVEKASQFDVLRKAGCDRVQGYLFSRELTPAAATRLLERSEVPFFSSLPNRTR